MLKFVFQVTQRNVFLSSWYQKLYIYIQSLRCFHCFRSSSEEREVSKVCKAFSFFQTWIPTTTNGTTGIAWVCLWETSSVADPSVRILLFSKSILLDPCFLSVLRSRRWSRNQLGPGAEIKSFNKHFLRSVWRMLG